MVDAACTHCVLGQIGMKRGNLVRAEADLRQSVSMLASSSEEYQLARSRYWLGRLLVQKGALDEAKTLLNQAEASFVQLDAALDLTAVQLVKREYHLN